MFFVKFKLRNFFNFSVCLIFQARPDLVIFLKNRRDNPELTDAGLTSDDFNHQIDQICRILKVSADEKKYLTTSRI